MSRLLTLLLVLAFVGFGLFFGTLNETPVTVDLFFITIQWPLALVVMSAFMAGIVLSGTLVYLSMWVGVKRRIRSLKAAQRKSGATAARPDSAADGSKALASGHG